MNESHREQRPALTVVLPDDPPVLSPGAAGALLRLLLNVAARRGLTGPTSQQPAQEHDRKAA